MSENNKKIIKESQLSVADYLAKFPENSADYKLLKEKAENIESITIQIVEEADQRRFEDTLFKEKNGSSYTVRAKL